MAQPEFLDHHSPEYDEQKVNDYNAHMSDMLVDEWKDGLGREFKAPEPAYEVRTTFNPNWKAFSFNFFLTKKEAIDFVNSEKIRYKRLFPKKVLYYRILENPDVDRCKCGRLYDTKDDCLFCEKIRYEYGG